MKHKPIYKLVDGKGRVLIPKDLRTASGMDYGDIVRLGLSQSVCRRSISSRWATNPRRRWRPMSVRRSRPCRTI